MPCRRSRFQRTDGGWGRQSAGQVPRAQRYSGLQSSYRYLGPDGEAETLDPGEDSNRQVAVDALDLTAVSSLAKPSVASSAVRLSGGAMRSTLP